MTKAIEKVAVIGAGIMGAAIAAHLVNARFSVYLLDIVPAEIAPKKNGVVLSESKLDLRNQIVLNGLNRATKYRPPPFFLSEQVACIQIGNLEDHLDWLKNVDWIIEAVSEDFEIKTRVLRQLDQVRRAGSIISSNTSGLSINRLAKGLTEDFRKHWLGTHFFNPPRYLKLLEIIPTAETLPSVLETITTIGRERLGKGIVQAKDTPSFVANRIGIFALQQLIRMIEEEGYRVDEVDQLTGPIIGRSKSATFRTLDIVGLDTFSNVTQNIYENSPSDEERNVFQISSFVEQMLERNWLGVKSQRGFYQKKKDGEIQTLDPLTMEYVPYKKVVYPWLQLTKDSQNLQERLNILFKTHDKGTHLIWKALSRTMVYAANRIPEISDNIVSIDNAMKWGFNWKIGPFETWDLLGIEAVAARVTSEGLSLPPLVNTLLQNPQKRFYIKKGGSRTYFDCLSKRYLPLEPSEGIILLSSIRDQHSKILRKGPAASLIDLGDGVLCLEFHSKMNTIGFETIQMISEGLKIMQENFVGMVIGNQGPNFSAGANLMLILVKAEDQKWNEIENMISTFQIANMKIKYSPMPVVVAPFGLTLGGGCEIALHAARQQAAAETYMGLVELGVGLIPAAGGSKEMVLRSMEKAETIDQFLPYLQKSFETIAMAKVSTSGLEAQKMGFMRLKDSISMNPEHLIADAKKQVLCLVREGYQKPKPPKRVFGLGRAALSNLKVGIYQMLKGGYISQYDFHLGSKLAYILCGGNFGNPQNITEQYLLDLEKEGFMSLCGEQKSLERIKYMLQRGKPLKN